MIIGSNSRSLVNFRGDLIESLIKSGWKVTGAGPNLTENTKAKLQAYGASYVDVPIDRSGMNPVKDLINFVKLTKIVKKVQPSHVLTYTVKPNIWGALAANRLGVDSFAMVTGLGYAFTTTQNQSLKQKLVRFLSKTLYSFSTSKNKKVIFQNPDDREDFIEYGCLKDASKTRIVNGSGVNMDYFRRVEMPDEPVCLMIGRLHKNKGVREYCEAAILVKEKFPKARFLIVGYFDEGPDGINKLDMDKWVSKGVEFLGRKEDVRDAISMASIYVLPSYREGTPRSTLEAMSMGRPIVTTDAPGCKETVIDAETGFIVPIRNVEVLAEKMERLVSDRELRSAMGQKSYEYCKEKYDVNSVNASLIDVLSE